MRRRLTRSCSSASEARSRAATARGLCGSLAGVSRLLIVALVCSGLAVGCTRKRVDAEVARDAAVAAAADVAAPTTSGPVSDPVGAVRTEFEAIQSAYSGVTGKMYSRADFRPLDDITWLDEGDFIGRLRSLFGAVRGDEYVLRHRQTGLVVTAYAAPSGLRLSNACRSERTDWRQV